MANFIGVTGSVSVTGTADPDIILIQEASGLGTDTVNAGAGNDVIVGDIDVVHVDASAGNSTFATAINIDDSARWSVQSNPMVEDDTIPYTTILGTGAGEFDVFSVLVGDGETLTADIDFGGGTLGGPSFDSELRLFNTGLVELETNDDGPLSSGGSVNSFFTDSFLTWENDTGSAQTVYLRVEQFNDVAISAGSTYLLSVSVTGHLNTNVATQGDDIINGDAGNDFIIGNDGNDTLNGGADNDTILGGNGNDFIDTGEGTDFVIAGNGNDTVLDGSTNDSIDLGDDNDAVIISTGSDTVQGMGGNDTLQFNDVADLGAGDNFDGGTQFSVDDVVIVATAARVFDFTDVSLTNWERFSFVNASHATGEVSAVFTAQQADQFSNFSVQNRLGAGGFAIDVRMGTQTTFDMSARIFTNYLATDRILITGDGDDETITGSVLSDSIVGNGGADSILGLVGNDTINGGDGNDTLVGGSGSVSMIGGNDNDLFFSLISAGTSSTVEGGLGNLDTLDLSAAGAVTQSFDTFTSPIGGGILLFSSIETIIGSGFADQLFEATDVSQIEGGAGDDTVNAGFDVGFDILFDGGADNDTFLSIGSATNFDLETGAVEGVAGRVINFENFEAQSSDNQTIAGTSGANRLTGNNGDDSLTGRAGDDTLIGGAGNDTLDGGDNNDSLQGGGDNDSLIGGSGNNTLEGGDGNDTLVGGDGNDSMVGGNDNDVIIALLAPGTSSIADGGAGDLDTIDLSNAGAVTQFGSTFTSTIGGGTLTIDGIETIIGTDFADELAEASGVNQIEAGGGDDTVIGGFTIGVDVLFDGGTGNDTFVNSVNTADYDLETGAVNGVAGRVTNFENYVPQSTGIEHTVAGTSGANSLTGSDGNDSLTGRAGNDTLIGATGNDTLNGGDDNDTLQGGGDNDSLIGGIGTDLLDGGDDNDTLEGGDGNDTLLGGTGNDSLVGGNDNDVIIDLLEAGTSSTADGGAGTLDTVDLSGAGSGISNDNTGMVTASTGGGQLLISNFETIIGTGLADQILEVGELNRIEAGGGNDTVTGGFNPGIDVVFDGGADIDTFVSTNNQTNFDLQTGAIGGVAGRATNFENFVAQSSLNQTVAGTSGANSLRGDNGNDSLIGRAGNDTLVGRNGNDTLVGGNNNDLLQGGSNDDSLNGGTGNDRLEGGTGNDTLIGGAGSDTLIGGDGIGDQATFSANFANFTVALDGDDVLLTVFGDTNVVDETVEFIQFGDRIVLNDVLAAEFNLERGVVETGEYGNGFNGLTDGNGRISANFEGRVGPIELTFTGYDIDTTNEVQILINNVSAGFFGGTAANNNAYSQHTLVLPAMTHGEDLNTITFVQSNPSFVWGIKDILIQTQAEARLTRGIVETTDIGNNYNGTTDADGIVRVTFTGTANDLMLFYDGYDIDTAAEVEVFVNGTSHGFINAGINNGMSSHQLLISAADQVAGENIILFEQQTPSFRWGIDNLNLVTVSNFDLTLNTLDAGEYGNNFGGASELDGQVIGRFVDTTGEDLLLNLNGFDIDTASEVEVMLNGASLGFLAAGTNNGEAPYQFGIDGDALGEGENVITFIQRTNNSFTWGVTDLLLRDSDMDLVRGGTNLGDFGNNFNSKTDADGKVFATFTGGTRDLALDLTGFDIDTGTEVKVLLNGASLGFLAQGVNNGTSDYQLTISAGQQRTGENVLTFSQEQNPAFTWGVTDVRISTVADSWLALGTKFNASFGNNFNGATQADGEVVATFTPSGTGDLVLDVSGFDIDVANEVNVRVNGTSVGFLTGGVDNGLSSHVFAIDGDLLIADQENLLTFEQTGNASFTWGVTNILLEEADAELIADTPELGSFGNNFNGATEADGEVLMTFVGGTDTFELHLEGFDIDQTNEVEIFLNGASQGFLTGGVDNGQSTHALPLASEDQRPGENVLSFVQAINPAFTWGITNIELVGDGF